MELTIHSLYMDFTFLTTGDFYIHIEFQTTDSGKKDLRRFQAYEGGGIKRAVTEMDCGIHTYRVIPVYLSDKDADTVLKRLQEKKQKGELFTEEDFAQLAIAPLMNNSNKERKDVILESLKLSKTEKISQQKKQWQCFTHWQINF